jgi:hypothetical protein
VNSVESRVRAAMSAAGDLAEREIRTAPSLRLPSAPAAGARRRHAPRRWTRWVVPFTAAAAVVALAVSLVLVRGIQNGIAVPPKPVDSAPAAPASPGGVPRYYVAAARPSDIVVGDSVTGTLLAKLAVPVPKNTTTFLTGITAAGDDRTFVVLALTYPTASLNAQDVFKNATGTARWYGVRLDPGTAHPARLTSLPVKPETVRGDGAYYAQATALSGSGQELAVTRRTASGGMAAQVFSVATGRLLHEWTTDDPSLSWSPKSAAQGLAGQPSLTWIDGDRVLAVETMSMAPNSGVPGFDTVRELNVARPSGGDLVADSKVVWNVRTGASPRTLLQSCAAKPAGTASSDHFISADGTTFGCAAVTGPGTDPNLSFLTYPLAPGTAATAKARVDYEVTNMTEKGVTQLQLLWISPSGDTVVGAWAIAAKGTLADAPNGLHVGAMSRGKFTPLRFPPGFDQQADITSITW